MAMWRAAVEQTAQDTRELALAFGVGLLVGLPLYVALALAGVGGSPRVFVACAAMLIAIGATLVRRFITAWLAERAKRRRMARQIIHLNTNMEGEIGQSASEAEGVPAALRPLALSTLNIPDDATFRYDEMADTLYLESNADIAEDLRVVDVRRIVFVESSPGGPPQSAAVIYIDPLRARIYSAKFTAFESVITERHPWMLPLGQVARIPRDLQVRALRSPRHPRVAEVLSRLLREAELAHP